MTIEANIRAYLLLAAPGTQVKQAPYEGDRPATPYLTYQIISVLENQNGFKSTYAAGKDTVRTSAVLTVSVNAYADKGYQLLANAKALGSAWEGRQALSNGGLALSFMQGGATNNLTGLGDTGFRSRFQCDLMFHADLTHERTRSLIDEWALTGELLVKGGSYVVNVEDETEGPKLDLDFAANVYQVWETSFTPEIRNPDGDILLSSVDWERPA
jgi:hypothetical protein